MFDFTDGHTDFVGNEKHNAEAEHRPADETGAAQFVRAVFNQKQSGDNGRNRSDNNQPGQFAAGVFKVRDKIGFGNALKHFPNGFGKINHNGDD